MGTIELPVRRLILASGLAVAVAIVPSVGYFAGTATPRTYHTIADPSRCTVTKSGGSSSLVCVPGIVPGGIGGAPTQQQLTAKNAQRSHAR
jgi:hypothetical protein